MAYIRKLPSGKFQATVRHPSGRKITKTDPLKRVVQAWATEVETAYRTGLTPVVRSHRVTVNDWHTTWAGMRMVEASTARKDESRWRLHVGPYWGGWPLDAIKRSDVQQWVKTLDGSRVGVGTVHGCYQLLSVMLSEAVDHGVIGANPCRRIALPRKMKPEPRWLTRHEYDRLQLALGGRTIMSGGRTPKTDPHAAVWQALVAVGCFCGLRPGELAGLDVTAVDLERQLLRVTQVVTQVPDGLREDGRSKHRFAVRAYPKTDRSVRTVPFPDEVAELLWQVMGDRVEGPVFTSPRGGRVQMVGNFPNQVWHPALRAAGIAPVRPYVLRHTCASWLVQAGVPDRQIMAILGHADNHLIATYAHLAPEQHDAVRAAWRTSGARLLVDPQAPEETRRSDEVQPPVGS